MRYFFAAAAQLNTLMAERCRAGLGGEAIRKPLPSLATSLRSPEPTVIPVKSRASLPTIKLPVVSGNSIRQIRWEFKVVAAQCRDNVTLL